MRRINALAASAVLILASLITIPISAYKQWVKYEPICADAGPYIWTVAMSKAYARGFIAMHYPHWNRGEWKALVKLWDTESHWNPKAYNKSPDRWTGKHAGGIPQLLDMKPNTPAPQQVARGLAYISHRYSKPSIAWNHHRKHNWY